MIDYKLINPEQGTYLEEETRFWYRDEDGKAYPVELEYLLPENRIVVEETYSEQDVWSKKVKTRTNMKLPYFPGDIYFNHKAVVSEDEYYFKDMLISTTSAQLNGATLISIGGGCVAPRVNSTIFKFVYENKTYLVETINNGSGYSITAGGKRGFGVISRLSRIYHPAPPGYQMLTIADIDPENPADMAKIYNQTPGGSKMLTVADIDPKTPDGMRLLSSLATLMTARDLYKVGNNIEEDKANPLLMGPMNNCDIDLFGHSSWTVGPF